MQNNIRIIRADVVKIDGDKGVINSGRGIRYSYPGGKTVIRVEGTAAFRNNNPGNMEYRKFARNHGAIGQDSTGFAIFLDWETGDKAQASLLREGRYRNDSIKDTIKAYAPKFDGNPTERYIATVTEESGLPEGKRISDMTDSEFNKFREAMKRFEDSTPGYDIVDFGGKNIKEWQRIDYIKTDKTKSSKNFGNYGPDLPRKYEKPVEPQVVRENVRKVIDGIDKTPQSPKTVSPINKAFPDGKVPINPSDTRPIPSSSSSHSGETLEYRDGKVWRTEEDGSTRGYVRAWSK